MGPLRSGEYAAHVVDLADLLEGRAEAGGPHVHVVLGAGKLGASGRLDHVGVETLVHLLGGPVQRGLVLNPFEVGDGDAAGVCGWAWAFRMAAALRTDQNEASMAAVPTETYSMGKAR